jgi:hypothetical protein
VRVHSRENCTGHNSTSGHAAFSTRGEREKWGRVYAAAATGASQISSPRVRVCVYLINASEGDLSRRLIYYFDMHRQLSRVTRQFVFGARTPALSVSLYNINQDARAVTNAAPFREVSDRTCFAVGRQLMRRKHTHAFPFASSRTDQCRQFAFSTHPKSTADLPTMCFCLPLQ